jgi:hypothetical protein
MSGKPVPTLRERIANAFEAIVLIAYWLRRVIQLKPCHPRYARLPGWGCRTPLSARHWCMLPLGPTRWACGMWNRASATRWAPAIILGGVWAARHATEETLHEEEQLCLCKVELIRAEYHPILYSASELF